MRVSFLCPGGREDEFYGSAIRIMECVARTLGIELHLVSANRDRETYLERGEELVISGNAGDVMLCVNEWESALELVPLADRHRLPMITLFQGIAAVARYELGEPGQEHSNWVAELVPDDYRAGRDLFRMLMEEARTRGLVRSGTQWDVAALVGPYTHASLLRLKGLHDCIGTYADVRLSQILRASWDRQRARSAMEELLEQGERPQLVWAACDSMALGCIEALEERGLRPGRDVLVGGIDWVHEAVERIASDDLAVSMGGHLFDGAWALALARDLIEGVESPLGSRIPSTLVAMTKENRRLYAELLDESVWAEVDWSRLSSSHPSSLVRSPISAELLFGTLPTSLGGQSGPSTTAAV